MSIDIISYFKKFGKSMFSWTGRNMFQKMRKKYSSFLFEKFFLNARKILAFSRK